MSQNGNPLARFKSKNPVFRPRKLQAFHWRKAKIIKPNFPVLGDTAKLVEISDLCVLADKLQAEIFVRRESVAVECLPTGGLVALEWLTMGEPVAIEWLSIG